MDWSKRKLTGLVLILLQMVVFNRIHLLGYATPLIYVGVVLTLPLHTASWVRMLMGFCFGLMADVTVNTPGVAAAAMTLLAVLQQPVLKLFVDRNADKLEPSMREMGGMEFAVYSLIMILLFTVVFYSLSFFTIFHLLDWVFSIIGSTLLTWILILFFESLRK